MTLLSVSDLVVAYRATDGTERRAVDRVGFRLERGETLGVVGESGSGKSTLARALLGYGRHGSRFVGGRVLLDGVDVLAEPDRVRRELRGRKVALVPQNPLQSLTPHMTIGEQIGRALARHRGLSGPDRGRAAVAALAAMRIDDPAAVLRRYPHEISGGQRQRAVIAAAMVGEPDLLVLDEPTTALDKSTEMQVLDLLRELRARTGCAMVVVSHDLRMIGALCGRMLVMLDGRVVEEGETNRILAAPSEAYTRSLVHALPRLVPGPDRPAPSVGRILDVEGLGFTYRPPGLFGPRTAPGARPALRDVRFRLAPGRTLGVVGESGSGKSTLGGLVAGLLAGHEGTMRLAGQPLSGHARRRSAETRRRVQMVFQDPAGSLNPRRTVGEIVARGFAVFHGTTAAEARRRTAEIFERMGLDPALATRLPGELSGGQQQRVAVARAFAAGPDLVVCDEITSALDVTVQSQVLALMRDLQERDGVAYLFVSHDLAVVSEMADDILVLRRGGTADLGPTARVLGGSDDGYTRDLVAAFEGRKAA
jgi:peptide/nickel transport system ATP-binding protein